MGLQISDPLKAVIYQLNIPNLIFLITPISLINDVA